jgi:hypothetical protein
MLDIIRTITEFLKSPEAIEAKKFQLQSYQQAEERLKEVTHNLSAELGKLINDMAGLGGKFRSFSDVLDKLRLKLAERDKNGNVPFDTQMILKGSAVAIGTLILGLLASHGRKMIDFFFKGMGSNAVSSNAVGSIWKRRIDIGKGPMGSAAAIGAATGVYNLATSENKYDTGMALLDISKSISLAFGPYGVAAAGVIQAIQSLIDYLKGGGPDAPELQIPENVRKAAKDAGVPLSVASANVNQFKSEGDIVNGQKLNQFQANEYNKKVVLDARRSLVRNAMDRGDFDGATKIKSDYNKITDFSKEALIGMRNRYNESFQKNREQDIKVINNVSIVEQPNSPKKTVTFDNKYTPQTVIAQDWVSKARASMNKDR